MLKGIDIVVLLDLAWREDHQVEVSPYRIRDELGISWPQRRASLQRAREAGLLSHVSEQVRRLPLYECAAYATRFLFPPSWSGYVAAGVPTAWSALPLNLEFHVTDDAHVVWSHLPGPLIGHVLAPLDPVVPRLALQNPWLHQSLALVDAVRIGRRREVTRARQILRERLL